VTGLFAIDIPVEGVLCLGAILVGAFAWTRSELGEIGRTVAAASIPVGYGLALASQGVGRTAWFLLMAGIVAFALARYVRHPGWGIFALMVWLVGWFSGSQGGADPAVEWVARTFSLDLESALTVVRIARKSIHFLFYGCLTYAAAHCFRPEKRGIWALAVSLLVALMDEGKQLSVGNRTGAWEDVALDMAGACAAMVLFFSLSAYRNRAEGRKLGA
jgi:hypothetical protein